MIDSTELLSQAKRALGAAEAFVDEARAAVAARVGGARLDNAAL